ncbi:unnamed protein product [Dovyalis caffra]|uniref:Uncharacterized protein n=1 Tax=Dovyalis caffra TaxID=77055 RepID=A0AAV1SND5_9ROSI|nr:unnamed protein product [Dovyalis caffra]
MQEPIRKAKPSEVGGILRRTIGATEAEERIKRVKFKHDRRRFGKEHELLSLEEAIFFVRCWNCPKVLLLKRVERFEFIYSVGVVFGRLKLRITAKMEMGHFSISNGDE